jgi:hypothetical protein
MEAVPEVTDATAEQLDNAPLRSLKRSMIDDALQGVEMPNKGEPIAARPSERDTVTPSAEDASEAVPEIYDEVYQTAPAAEEETYDELMPELEEGLYKRGLLDGASKTLPEEAEDTYEETEIEDTYEETEIEDSYEETVPEVTSAAYEAYPTPTEVYEVVPEVTSAAYEAKPTPADTYGALPTPSDVYEAAPTPSEVYNAAPVKPSDVYEVKPTPTKEAAYEALPTPAQDTYESTPVEDSYEDLDMDLDLDIFRKD